MPISEDSELLALWAEGLESASTTAQYRGRLRRFFADTACTTVEQVKREHLIRYVASIDAPAARRKMISALESFFGFASMRGIIPGDPAHFLSKGVRVLLAQRELVQHLLKAGVEKRSITDLRWRDVMPLITPSQLVPTQQPAFSQEVRTSFLTVFVRHVRTIEDPAAFDRLMNRAIADHVDCTDDVIE